MNKVFDRDQWAEVWHILQKNRWRTALTFFGVGWGMFMLMLMMGMSQGLETGIKASGIGAFATNTCLIHARKTSLPYKGNNVGREVVFRKEDIAILQNTVKGIELIAPIVDLERDISYEQKEGRFHIYGHYPAINRIEPKALLEGRWINDHDLKESKKVAVIGKKVKQVFFSDTVSAIGKYIRLDGIFLKVIGVHTHFEGDRLGKEHNETITVPYSTFAEMYHLGNVIGGFAVTAGKNTSVSMLQNRIISTLKRKYQIAPQDQQAIGTVNIEEAFRKVERLFYSINLLSWVVGLLTLFSGTIGITNIMLITIKERTKEIGIRRAIGATPADLVTQIFMESLTMIFLSGLTGMLCGAGFVRIIDAVMTWGSIEIEGFLHPAIGVHMAMSALFVMTVLGVLAGIVPAARAIRISPVTALKDS